MSHPPDIIHHGFEQARYALSAVINMTDAHLRPLTLPAVRPRTGFTPATPTPLPEGTELVTFPARCPPPPSSPASAPSTR